MPVADEKRELPPKPWKAIDGAAQRRWRRPLDGEEVFMTWQEVHRQGHMVMTVAFSIRHPALSLDDFADRIKRGWAVWRRTWPMLACRFITEPKTGDYRAVEYQVPQSDDEVRAWADKTVVVKSKGEYDFEQETANHPDRPDQHVCMLRILEDGGRLIKDDAKPGEDLGHLVLFTISHSMADIYTLCDMGRMVLEAVEGKPATETEQASFTWGDEVPYLPTSLDTAYKHFLGRPSANEKKISARYWGSLFLPLLKKNYCALPLKSAKRGPADPHRVVSRMSIDDSMALIRYSKKIKVSVTALTYAALALELENITGRNGKNHCVGVVRNNRRFFPVPPKHEFKSSPAPAGTMSMVELPLSPLSTGSDSNGSLAGGKDDGADEKASHDRHSTASNTARILALARGFNDNIRVHVDGTAAELGLANIDALIKPYMAMQQHNVAGLLVWLPKLWSPKTAANVLRAAAMRSKSDSAKPPPITFSAHGNLDELLPRKIGEEAQAELCAYLPFTRPGEDTIAVITYTHHSQFHIRIVLNARYYDRDLMDGFVYRSLDHLRSLYASP